MSYGFGYYIFGHFPFGHSDFGEDAIVRAYPPTYLEDPTTGEVNSVLKNYLSIAKNKANEKKFEIEAMEDQIDPNRVRADLLKFLGSTIAVNIDEYEPDSFRRSLVSNAVPLYRIKGTEDSFRIRGKISGYDVDVVNIWHINKSLHVRTTTDFEFGVGIGGTDPQLFEGTMFTYPLIKGTVKLKIGSVYIAEDDGNGNFVPSLGSTYLVDGSLDYRDGSYSIEFTPAIPVGEVVLVDCETGVEDRELSIGDGLASQNIVGTSQSPYPIYPTSVKIYDDGVLIAHDDGDGNLIADGSYVVTGRVGYDRATFDFTITPAAPVGNKITTNYDKTLLADFLECNPDDIYEIPADSGEWYVTIPPSRVAGNFSELCDYCRTTYIKLRFLVPQGAQRVINMNTGSENFFDRLIRKLKEVTPIHVRDLLYELQMIVVIDESVNMSVGSYAEEINWLPFSGFYRYDVVPADVVTTDKNAYVTGTVELV
jgi:phage tail-like protein